MPNRRTPLFSRHARTTRSTLFSVLSLCALLLLAGCATLSETECARSDWYTIGMQDGRDGFTPDRLDQHQRACAKHGYGIDPRAYDAGYREGLKAFCIPPRGFDAGRSGTAYRNQCPPAAERIFLPAYYMGKDVYDMEEDLKRIDREVAELRKELRDDETTKEARRVAEKRLRQLENDRIRGERERDRTVEQARRHGYIGGW